MENTTSRSVSSRGRKRYNCCYCNVYFHQTDSWQRHNRKHTGVEIECDDCGQMCSDFFELKSHQRLCEAYRVYSEEHYTEISDSKESNKEQSHDTPDSTSNKQEHSNNYNASSERGDRTSSPWPESREEQDENSPSVSTNDEVTKNHSMTSELDDFIGEDSNNSIGNTQNLHEENENDDPETEAMIGVDESVPHLKTDLSPDNNKTAAADSNSISGADSQIVIKVESALNDAKRGIHQHQKIPPLEKEGRPAEMHSFLPRPPTLTDAVQALSMDNADMNKKYQPYFCKNCGARFTRKDSVTRHLKKGTCSGKSAIVCSICGKVFPELYELQQHFKLDHKNVILTPSTVIPHRTILPKPSDLPESARSQHFGSFAPGAAVPFVIREQPLPHGSRGASDPKYRTMSHNMQGVFYPPPSNNRTAYSRPPRVVYSSQNQGGGHLTRDHLTRDHYSSSRQYDPKYPVQSSLMRKETPSYSNEKSSHNRKRDYSEYHHREHYTPEHNVNDPYTTSKRNKLEYEVSEKKPSPHLKSENNKNQINLSEYTNNAMNSQQYFSKRFVQKDGMGHDTEPPNQIHQCKICGNEFPRYEYLLTHLRKHKEKLEYDEENFNNMNGTDTEKMDVDMSNESGSPDNQSYSNSSRHNFESSKSSFVENHEVIPIVHQQPPPPPSAHRNLEGGKIVHPPPPPPPGVEQMPVFTIPIQPSTSLQAGVVSENTMDAITPGVDGKFRPFICENCGQRFTRKDSLVRHAKKQTCYEEQIDLKCRHCDKTFRYHKCLIQHQELVHGISREEQAKSKPVKTSDDEEDTDSDRSDKNESFQEPENPLSTASFDISKPPKHRSPMMVEVKPLKQSSSTSYPGARSSQVQEQQPPSRALSFVPTNPYTKIEIPANPYNKVEGPSNEAPKFIPPRIDDKVNIGELGNGVISSSANQQDTQYIGYCTVARPFQCEYCGDRFAHRHSLKRHIRRHLGIGIPCVECGKLYRDQSEWRRHQKSIHNRHYEKNEVPSRISYRDGMENGMIGMVPGAEFAFDGSDSDKSGDEEITMVKPVTDFQQHNSSFGNHSSMADEIQKAQSEITQHLKEANYEVPRMSDDKGLDMGEENKAPSKQAFNFKSYSSGDKDSRKSALDRYLQSTHSDEDEEHEVRETTTVFGSESKQEFVEANNNNNNDTLGEKNKFVGFHNERMGEMVNVGMSND